MFGEEGRKNEWESGDKGDGENMKPVIGVTT